MRPLETLRNEHGLIRQFLDNLALAVAKLENEERPPKEFFEKAVLFARTFADTFHHIKEEHVMFVRLAQKNNGAIDGQIESLRHQHDRGRNYISALWPDGGLTHQASLRFPDSWCVSHRVLPTTPSCADPTMLRISSQSLP